MGFRSRRFIQKVSNTPNVDGVLAQAIQDIERSLQSTLEKMSQLEDQIKGLQAEQGTLHAYTLMQRGGLAALRDVQSKVGL